LGVLGDRGGFVRFDEVGGKLTRPEPFWGGKNKEIRGEKIERLLREEIKGRIKRASVRKHSSTAKVGN